MHGEGEEEAKHRGSDAGKTQRATIAGVRPGGGGGGDGGGDCFCRRRRRRRPVESLRPEVSLA